VLGGEKNADKHKMFNDCLVCCGMKWCCLNGPNKGKQLQPSAFAKHMEQLTIVFAEKGIRYDFGIDFNRKGEFHGVLKTQWNKIREDDPSHGTGANRARTDPDLFIKFLAAIKNKKIRPCEEPEHLCLCVIFAFGFCLGLRGSSEHMDLKTSQLYIGECTMADGQDLCGLKWGGLKVPHSKTRQLKLTNTRLTRDQDVVLSFVEDSLHRYWNPFQVLCFYIDHCHPLATKVHGRILKRDSKEALELKKQCGKDIWFAQGGKGSNWNMGPSKHRALCKQIGFLSGVDNWESCAGHALRALCIAHCLECGLSNAETAAKVRHASTNSSKTHEQETSKRKANRMAAMNPSGKLTKKQKTSVKSVKSVKLDIKNEEPIDIVDVNDREDVQIVETQPMLPKNQSRFQKLAGCEKKPAAKKPVAMAMVGCLDDEKENETPAEKLKRLEFENKILRLEQENARMKEELTRVDAPPRHRRSYPPSYPRSSDRESHHRDRSSFRHRFETPECSDDDIHDYPTDNHRNSHPPRHARRSRSPPRCYNERSHRHGEDSDGSHGDYHRRY